MFKKVIHPCDVKYHGESKHWPVFCKINIENGRLSITGVIGPTTSGNAHGGCGQIDMEFKDRSYFTVRYAKGWDYKTFEKFLAIWDRWHLNDMKAGSPRQEEFIRSMYARFPEFKYEYQKVCGLLAEAGLNPDTEYLHDGKPYLYGHAWLMEELPQDVIDWLMTLPDTDKDPAWV